VKASPSGKESIIKDEGVPFATLLWLRGHITLYIGEYKGEPVMFHNVWGVRTDDGNGEGRHIIGRAVVTSLQPGAELKKHVSQRPPRESDSFPAAGDERSAV
jgi:hypothetical protein